jgi:hypothetical protein
MEMCSVKERARGSVYILRTTERVGGFERA